MEISREDCEDGGNCIRDGVTDVLPSSSTVPPAPLTSSVPLNVGDDVDNTEDDTESESNESVSNEIGERKSDKDCVLTEVIKYQTLADSIKPHVERKDVKGNDTFEISDWWKANCAMLPAFTYVLRAVLTNSPNSCPPERLFSIFNSTFDADQSRSYADYMQLSMQSH